MLKFGPFARKGIISDLHVQHNAIVMNGSAFLASTSMTFLINTLLRSLHITSLWCVCVLPGPQGSRAVHAHAITPLESIVL